MRVERFERIARNFRQKLVKKLSDSSAVDPHFVSVEMSSLHLGKTTGWSMLFPLYETTTVNRRNKDGTTVAVPCPVCVALYNMYMGGVDHADQLRGYYHVRWKCMKKYKYIFFFFV